MLIQYGRTGANLDYFLLEKDCPGEGRHQSRENQKPHSQENRLWGLRESGQEPTWPAAGNYHIGVGEAP
jgi:hypothetical protein